MGWTQRELGRRGDVSQTAISRFERGAPSGLDLDAIERLARALGGRLELSFQAPFLADRARQRDSVHARCLAFAAKRLRGHGWEVATEVEIDGRNGPDWIDLLAFHAASGVLVVIEVKTEIHDVGRIQRTLAWYERRAWPAARERGWIVRQTHAALLLLATDAVDARLRENRSILDEAFPRRADELSALVADPGASVPSGWGVAMIDPLSRRDRWLRPTRLDARRSRAAYEDYAAVARRLSGGSRS